MTPDTPGVPDGDMPARLAHSGRMDTIGFDSTGTYEFDTEAGTTYVLTLGFEEEAVTRKPGLHRPRGKEAVRRLPGDFEPLFVAGRSEIAVGHRASLSVTIGDDIDVRETSVVVAIRQRAEV